MLTTITDFDTAERWKAVIRRTDFIKTCVRLGLGVGLTASVAYDPNIDEGLIVRDCGHLFGRRVARIALATRNMPRNYVFALIERLASGVWRRGQI